MRALAGGEGSDRGVEEIDVAPGGLLPEWYMPGGAGAGQLTAWRRSVALVIIAAFLLITAYGLCNTYGDMVLRRV
jgi:hypothetical protein